MSNLRHPFRWLIAAAMLGLAVQPVLLPHAGWVQVVIGAAAGAQGYALAALCTLLVRPLLARRLGDGPAIPTPRPALTAALGAAIIGVATLTAHAGQLAASARTGMPPPTLLADALAVAGAVLAGTAVIGLGIGIGIAVRAGFRMLVWLLRRVPRRVAALVLAPVLVLTGSTAASADSSPGAHLTGTQLVSTRPAGTSSLNSTLGVEGEDFLRDRPKASTIGAVTGRPAQMPVRVYVGRDAATTPQARAALAVRELDRTGGFRRAAVLISVPTGSGWVNPAAASALEYLYGGDIATVVVQYAAAPSWVAYLRGGEGVQASTRALTDAIRARLNRIPAGQRPRLLAYGESLGAWGGLRAYDGVDGGDGGDGGGVGQGLGMARRTDGALWAGIPGSLPDRSPRGTRTLVHSDDPVPAWSLPLMLHESSAWPARWLPVVSFWQATGDVISALKVPSGFGHRYGSELVDAWRPLISTAAVPGAAPLDRLNAVRAAIG